MVKLNNNEVQYLIEQETNCVSSKSLRNIPKNAYSKFSFEIKENIEDLVYEMTKKSRKHHPQERNIDIETGEVYFCTQDTLTYYELHNYQKNENGASYELHDPTFYYPYATVKEEKDKLTISTALSGFKYMITQNKDRDGCIIEFSGPLNGLLRQALLPHMTYVPNTLKGKFITLENMKETLDFDYCTGKEFDLTPYMPIDLYCALREAKNKGYENYQDGYGWQINAAFNNEISCFDRYYGTEFENEQERKNVMAQRDFENNEKLSDYRCNSKKSEIRERIEKYKQMTLDIRKNMDKSTPIKNVCSDMIFNTSRDR
jgi:hypothetical protein